MSEGNWGKAGIIINSASYDRVAYALTIASALAANRNDVYVLFTYGAIQRLMNQKADEIGLETDEWIRDKITVGVLSGAIPKISNLLSTLKKCGGKIFACVSALALHNILEDDLTEEVNQVLGITSFLEKVEKASFVLYV